jgi:hypothetical protein
MTWNRKIRPEQTEGLVPYTGATQDINLGVNNLIATTISATTYQNLPIDVFITGGTYSSGTTRFTNNTGGTFSVTGFTQGTVISIKISDTTLLVSGWDLVGDYYQYTFTNVNIVSTGYVDFTPNNASNLEVTSCKLLPEITTNNGNCVLYSQFPPQNNIVGEMIINII